MNMKHDWRELYDYPMSWDFWRAACVYNGERDPGPDELPHDKPDIIDLEDRIGNLEAISSQRGSIPRAYYDELRQLKTQVRYLQSKVIQSKPQTPQKEVDSGIHHREDITNRFYK